METTEPAPGGPAAHPAPGTGGGQEGRGGPGRLVSARLALSAASVPPPHSRVGRSFGKQLAALQGTLLTPVAKQPFHSSHVPVVSQGSVQAWPSWRPGRQSLRSVRRQGRGQGQGGDRETQAKTGRR